LRRISKTHLKDGKLILGSLALRCTIGPMQDESPPSFTVVEEEPGISIRSLVGGHRFKIHADLQYAWS
jgi:hypothetical protein